MGGKGLLLLIELKLLIMMTRPQNITVACHYNFAVGRQQQLRHTVVCRAAKKVARNRRVLFTRTKISPISTSRILKTTERISTKFTYFMLYIYLTLHTKFNVDCASGSRDICF